MSAISGIEGFGTKWYLDESMVKEYYRRADEGDMECQYELARVLVPGEDFGAFKRDATSAVHYYELAANQGCIDAAFNLANLYEKGGFKFEPDIHKAFYWRKKCTDLGDKEACRLVSKMYLEGRGTERDVVMAVWYKEQGERENIEYRRSK